MSTAKLPKNRKTAAPAAPARRRTGTAPPDPALAVPVEVLDEQGRPLLVMPMLQAAGRGLCFRKAVTALFAGDALYLRRAAPPPLRRETRREVLDLFVAPVPAELAAEDVAPHGPAAILGYEPAVRFTAELPARPGAPVRLSLFTARLTPGEAALAGRGLLRLDADELRGLVAQAPEQFSPELLRCLEAGLLFPDES